MSIISCNNSILFLLRVVLPILFPSIMAWRKFSCLRTCRSHLCFLCQIVSNMLPVSLALTNISSFVTFSVQLIFSILGHVHFSNVFNSFLLALFNIQVSATYSATCQTVLFIIGFFAHSSISLSAVFTYTWTMPCSACWSSINRHTLLWSHFACTRLTFYVLFISYGCK